MNALHNYARLAQSGRLVSVFAADGVRIGRPLEETVVFVADLEKFSIWAAPIVMILGRVGIHFLDF